MDKKPFCAIYGVPIEKYDAMIAKAAYFDLIVEASKKTGYDADYILSAIRRMQEAESEAENEAEMNAYVADRLAEANKKIEELQKQLDALTGIKDVEITFKKEGED